MMATTQPEEEAENTNENAPLLPNSDDLSPPTAPPDEYGNIGIPPPAYPGPGELPPPYTPNPGMIPPGMAPPGMGPPGMGPPGMNMPVTGPDAMIGHMPANMPMNAEPSVVCRVCGQIIYIRGRQRQRVVKCSFCGEATPIKPPPEGKKYIRCPCNALLTCKVTSSRISCPRENCKRIINVGGPPPTITPVASATAPGAARLRVTCGHCNEIFMFRTTLNLARCPHCRRVSSVGPNFARSRAILFAVVGFIFIAAGIGVTVATLEIAKSSGGIYVVWIGAFIAGILNMIRSCYYCTMTVSPIGNETA